MKKVKKRREVSCVWQEAIFSRLVYKLNCLLLSASPACSLFFAMIKSHIHYLIYYKTQNLSQFYGANIQSCSWMHVSVSQQMQIYLFDCNITEMCTWMYENFSLRSQAKRRIKHELNLILHKFQLDSSLVDFSLSTHKCTIQTHCSLP